MMINQGYDGGERLVDNKEEGEVVEKVFMSEKTSIQSTNHKDRMQCIQFYLHVKLHEFHT